MSVKPLNINKIYFQQDKLEKKVLTKKPKVKTINENVSTNGNLDMNLLLNKLMNKMDNLASINGNNIDVYGEKKLGAVDIDIQ